MFTTLTTQLAESYTHLREVTRTRYTVECSECGWLGLGQSQSDARYNAREHENDCTGTTDFTTIRD